MGLGDNPFGLGDLGFRGDLVGDNLDEIWGTTGLGV